MIGHRELNLDDYLAILRRRMWWIIIPALVLPLTAYLVSLRLQNKYLSQTLVLVEQQKVPDTFVQPVVTEDLSFRLATMQEQILSRTRLQPLIERFGLHKDKLGKVPMEDLVDEIRKSIQVTPIRADQTRTRGLPGFYIAFTADTPRLAQQVCAEITSMFMSENLKAREQTAEGTTDFLRSQLEDSKRNLDEQDSKLAQFKRKYIGQLPGQEQTNLSILAALNSQLEAVTQAVTRAQQDKTYSESLLAQQTAAWRETESDNNPRTLQQQLDKLQAELMTLQGRYTDDHPDVIKTKKEIAQVKTKFDEAAASKDNNPETQRAFISTEPPQLEQLRLQIHQLEKSVRQGASEQQRLKQEIGKYQARIEISPAVEEQYKLLTRDYDTAQKFYDNLLAKKTQSEMATDLEKRQQGEQFRVMDPPNLPEKPIFPNRPLIAAMGLAGGLVLGLTIVFLKELRDKSLRTERDVQVLLELPTLVFLPSVDTEASQNSGHTRRFWKRSKADARAHRGGRRVAEA